MRPEKSRQRRRFAALIVAATALLALPLAAAPAYAAPPPPIATYVALGDSYAAGQGAGSYIDPCLRSPNGYAAQLDAVPRYNLLRQPACSGALIDDVLGAQISSVNRGTTLVTITAGANDLGIAQAFVACAPDLTSQACQAALAAGSAAIGTIAPKMGALIGAVQSRAPHATIVVTGYPAPFAPGYAAAVPVAGAVDAAAGALNSALQAAVAGAAAQGATVTFAPVAFGEHAIGGSEAPWLGGDSTDVIDFMHPNAAGATAYRDAILTALN
ncbi:lysophospholipase L1-like esterase [Microbacterium sp. W4I4]|uniref:SGNH/GDSL hydrolase family protein n=1 Tax=Microbacterium sp. W4I4 TaxID=3042295 RepID=UPI00277E6ECF|nr:SGNH/GDSL hydrolase family protein [Microbacterium sp. W4I4]MDQ0614597.1 lysophospholipase L1-like esterase [Microbacterium sp. W4I4]